MMKNFLFLTTVVLATLAGVTCASVTEAPQSSTTDLPGHVTDLRKQCKDQGYRAWCDPEPRMCKHLRCLDFYGGRIGWQCTDASVPALDGTPCGFNAECLNGNCQTSDGTVVAEI